jgi:capsule polysaccharide modification protein KpsS
MSLPYFPAEKLNELEYAYYPLHVEPEIALSLFGREYLNQIELIRNIAKSLPISWKLVVKDHPAGVGRRNIGYYKKLLEIPNVVLVSHYVDSAAVIENVKLVFTVSGFSGFEAILEKKPVITFGKTFYDVLPDFIVRHIQSLHDLPHTVSELLENYKYSEKDVVHLVAAIMKNSTGLNLYEQVLNKKERITVENKTLDDQKTEFVDFMLRWIS